MIDRIILTFSKRCNMACPFCYGYFNGECIELERCLEIIKKCYSYGIRRISFAGGDPFLFRDIGYLIDYAFDLGMELTLDTNALSYNRNKHASILKKLDIISLPLDGATPEVHDKVRNFPGSYKKIIDTLKTVSKETKVRINTVVVRQNYEQLDEQFLFMQNFNIFEWHIYEYIPLARGQMYYQDLFVPYEKYSAEIDLIKKSFSKFSVEHCCSSERVKKHLFVSSDGMLYSNSKESINNYYFFGNVICEENFKLASKYIIDDCETGI